MVFHTSGCISSVASLLKNLSKSLLQQAFLRLWFHKPTVTLSLAVVFEKARMLRSEEGPSVTVVL